MRYLEIGESMLSPRNEHHFLGAAISGIFGTLQQSSANRANFRNTQTTNQFNMKEAQKQRDWQEKMWGMVTPYVGVWIETLELAFNADGFQGHTLRGCVD